MMKITLQNYESYLLDYAEGTLSPLLRKQVEDFLLLHPELEEEMQLLKKDAPIERCSVRFPARDKILRSFGEAEINAQNFEEFCIAHAEGELSEEQSSTLLDYTKADSEKEKLFTLYTKLKLEPDTTVTYQGKSKLMKRSAISLRPVFIAVASIAAAAVVGIVLLNNPSVPEQNLSTVIAENNNTSDEETKEGKENSTEKPEEREKKDKPAEKSSVERKAEQLRPVTLAKFDTTNSDSQEKVVLAKLEPRSASLPEVKATVKIEPKGQQIPMQEPPTQEKTEKEAQKSIEKNTNLLAQSPDRLIFSAVSLGIKGFNSLTENNLALHTKENEAGNIESFKLESERFEFQRKIRRN